MITLGLVDSVDADGVYVTMPGSRGLLRGPYQTLQNVTAGDRVLVVRTDDGEDVIVGQAGAESPRSLPASSTDNTIARFDGTGGALQNSAVTIDDSGDLTVAGNNVVVRPTSSYARVVVDAASGASDVRFQKSSVTRWLVGKDSDAESGGNTGSRFLIRGYADDAGSNINALWITRATGRVTVGAPGATAGLEFGPGGPVIMAGSGAPENVVTAKVGSLWLRTDGGAGTTMYLKETGTGNTGWVAQ